MTENLDERLRRHNEGDGARITSRNEGWKTIYFEAYLHKKDALGREKFLKSGSGRRYLKKQLKHYLEEK